MKVGLKLVHSGPGATPDLMLRWTRYAEALGFHLLMTADHFALTREVLESYPAPYYEPFTNMSWLAAQTEKIEFGTTVIVVPYRNPLLLAQLCANIDQLSRGRLIFGIGIGWAESEFEIVGAPHNRRGAMTDDYMQAIEALWSNSQGASYQGEFISFEDVTLDPPPFQSRPRVWVGGNSDAALRRTIRFGEAWHPIRPRLHWLKDEAMPKMRRMADEAGKPVPALCPRIACHISDSPLPDDRRMAGEGSLQQIHADLRALEELDAQYVVLDTKLGSPTTKSPKHHETAWPMLATVAEKLLDVERGMVRSL